MLLRVIVAGLVGAVVSMIMGWLVWGTLLASYFASTMTPAAKTFISTEPRLMPLIAAQLGFGLFYAFVFERWANVRTLMGGIVAGAILGFSIGAIMDLMNDAFMINMHIGSNTPVMLVDIACGTFVGAVIGAAEGLVLGMMSKGGSTPTEAAA